MTEEEEEYQPDPKQIDEFEKLSKKVESENNGNGKSGKNKKSKTKKSVAAAADEEPQKRAIFVPRYITNEDNLLAEAVIVGGRPMFAMALGVSTITLEDAIEIDDSTMIKPPERISYMSKPYTFKSKEEFQDVVENIKTKNLDILYKKVKSIWQKYIDADDFHISLCAADTIFTYFQDKIGLTHYPFFVGGNDSGKSNNLTVIHFLAYRNMISSGMTAANIYQFLGSDSEGLGTICEDEADNIDQDHDKMRIYKNGYTTGIPVFRIDTSFSGRKQLRFNTFGFKAFGAEKLPDSVTARGFNQRIVPLPCTYGFPLYDISEVVNAAGEEEYEELLEELNTMRNALFVYRLLHFKDKIPNIKLNIQNREKQLFKPVLRLFQNTETTLNELLPVISRYVSQKRESNANTLHAFLYTLITDLIKVQDTYELESSLIWNIIKERLHGKDIPYKPQSFDTVEYGIISQKGIIETLIQVFGAERSRDKKSRKLMFSDLKLEKLSKIYDLSLEVKVVTHMTHVTHVGLDRHLIDQPDDNKIQDSDQENQNLHGKTIENIENITSDQNDKGAEHSPHVSQASHVSPEQKQEEGFSFKCFYCDNSFNGNVARVNHADIEHPNKPHYPTEEAFRNRLER
jgi:hypothetical protein